MTKHIFSEYKIESFTVGTVGSSSSLLSSCVFHILASDDTLGKLSDNQDMILFSRCTVLSLWNSNTLCLLLQDYYLPDEGL